jgi:DnaK suppressor protein
MDTGRKRMTKITLEFDELDLSKRLRDARREILESLGERDEVHIEQTADEMDQARANEARELAITNLTLSARKLRLIEKALERLDTGEYGICANCEDPVGAKRLRAVPWAEYCLKCQEIADRDEFGRGREVDGGFLNAA